MTAPEGHPSLLSEQHGLVRQLTLNRPAHLNALGTPLISALHEAFDDIAGDATVRAVLISGAGRAFCAGADVAELETFTSATDFRTFVGRLTRCLSRLQRLPQPSVAALHGVAFGGGLELALACDLRVATRSAKLGMPEIKLGVLPGAGGTQRLPRLVPPAVAKQMILTGEPISGERAHALGLVNEVGDGDILPAALALAASLAAGAPLALEAGKRLVDDGAQMPLDDAVAYERETVSVLFGTQDRTEGLLAFRERRPPRFVGG